MTNSDFGNLTLSGSNVSEFFSSYNSVIKSLPPEIRKQLSAIQGDYAAAYGFDGMHARMGNRTISQIISEYKPTGVKPIASGEIDGVRFAVYPPPPGDKVNHGS